MYVRNELGMSNKLRIIYLRWILNFSLRLLVYPR